MSNYPPGCTVAQIDAAFGRDDNDEIIGPCCVECGDVCDSGGCPICSAPLCDWHDDHCSHILAHSEQPEPADEVPNG